VSLRVNLSNGRNIESLRRHLILLLDPVLVIARQLLQGLHVAAVAFVVVCGLRVLQILAPLLLIQIQQHVLVVLVLVVVDNQLEVVFVESVVQRDGRRFFEVTHVGSRLVELLVHHAEVRVDESKRVDDHFTLHGLYRVNDDGDVSRVEFLEALFTLPGAC